MVLLGWSYIGAAVTSGMLRAGILHGQLRLLCSSAGDFILYSHNRGSEGSITTRTFVYHIYLFCSHMIRYLIIWPVLSI